MKNMDKFTVCLPLSNEYLTTVRLTTGGICALAEFDVDAAEDFKVCVTESLLILKRNGFGAAKIEFGVGETLSCAVFGQGERGEAEGGPDAEISYALLDALLGNAEFSRDGDGVVCGISFGA